MAKQFTKLRYKEFTFPHNPSTTSFTCDKAYVKHKYPKISGAELEDFGTNAIVITGNGEFFGSKAYTYWSKLWAEFLKQGTGSISHPVFTNVSRGIMTKLTANLEARENYISYSFEIVADGQPKNTSYVSVVNTTKSTTVVSVDGKTTTTSNIIKHTVKSGEYLIKICKDYSKKYGVTVDWKLVASYNKLKNPELLSVGQKIYIVW